MKNIEEILQKLLAEQDFLKEMQGRIVENYDIMIQNQQQNANNHEVVVHNQSTIIRNQEIIVNNQINIVRNQKQIVQNQVQLEAILQTQVHLLNLVKKLVGENESLEVTQEFVGNVVEAKRESINSKPFNNPTPL
ncbi:hypothetical protein Emtol_1055 [Emticicia oligotrophica DSM 17448]|uniref:Uncharacterized protein n=1 Tax=Emticicia oligotrophica (strain DSM 17448 / CIP 109782 / MTCC 6937 / GPTSA100-15) TaxID=929562 RepID=A0ABM5MYH9_EMTOG|nr:hypothetical protein [Emticicia oligotrophica]AFK02205.1 hypothetical protein Emtol_1055 [Emticicia oligotrophica DSM 17448]